jgi:hypothetical protein
VRHAKSRRACQRDRDWGFRHRQAATGADKHIGSVSASPADPHCPKVETKPRCLAARRHGIARAQAQGAAMSGRIVDLSDERFRRDVEAVCKLGPRVVAELLVELGMRGCRRTEIDAAVRRYAALDQATVTAVGGDRWPPP